MSNRSPQGIFISGTGTDVGKTYTSAFLYHILKDKVPNLHFWKPVQCGAAEWQDQAIESGDRGALEQILGYPTNNSNTIFLKTPASPHLAYKLENQTFNKAPLLEAQKDLHQQSDFIICEGAGGLHVPIQDDYNMMDLAKDLGYEVLLTALPGLGTLNHTLLSIEALQSRQIPIKGFVFSCTHPDWECDSTMTVDNYQSIERISGIPFLGFIPFMPMLKSGQKYSSQNIPKEMPLLKADAFL